MTTPRPTLSHFRGLDHIAIVVRDTDTALSLWRDQLGFPVLYSETVNNGSVRLTHLDLGNSHLQLVQPLSADHPLQSWLAKNGPGLHHFCLAVDHLEGAIQNATSRGAPPVGTPHQGTHGKRAVFLDKTHTQGIQVELTGP